MRDVSPKATTLRTATARAVIFVSKGTTDLIVAGKIPKGDPIPVARVAGIQAAKNTSSIIPFCHPLPIDHADCAFSVHADRIEIESTVTAIHKTGVEMEALTAASVAALTLYDMLKPVDANLRIGEITLLSKTGGKSGHPAPQEKFSAAVVVLSDSTASGDRKDESGRYVEAQLKTMGVHAVEYFVLPDDEKKLAETLKELADVKRVDLVLTTGGTGLGPKDITPEATRSVIDREVPGISETIRSFGQDRIPTAMLARNVAGVRGRTLIVNLPGSLKGVQESLSAILPGIFHAAKVIGGAKHD